MNPILLCIQTPGKAKSIVICYLNIGNICSYRDIGHIPSSSGLVNTNNVFSPLASISATVLSSLSVSKVSSS